VDDRTQPHSHPSRERAKELLRAIQDAVTIEPPPRIVPRPGDYADRQRRHVVERLTAQIERLAAEDASLDEQARLLRRRNKALERQTEELTEQIHALAAPEPRELASPEQVRAVPVASPRSGVEKGATGGRPDTPE